MIENIGKISQIINGDCEEELENIYRIYGTSRNIIIVSDPPFNIGYKYNTYNDKMTEEKYYEKLELIFGNVPSVVVHYPEALYKLAFQIGKFPEKVISWVYNSNTGRQHRDIAFFDVKPDMSKVRQPYKNLSDKRIQKRIAEGKTGAKLYDWWEINQVKNVSKDKTNHPCQMPIEVMSRIIGILPEDALIVDPFCGSGTTGVSCTLLGRDFIGIEIDKEYSEISQFRIENAKKLIQG